MMLLKPDEIHCGKIVLQHVEQLKAPALKKQSIISDARRSQLFSCSLLINKSRESGDYVIASNTPTRSITLKTQPPKYRTLMAHELESGGAPVECTNNGCLMPNGTAWHWLAIDPVAAGTQYKSIGRFRKPGSGSDDAQWHLPYQQRPARMALTTTLAGWSGQNSQTGGLQVSAGGMWQELTHDWAKTSRLIGIY